MCYAIISGNREPMLIKIYDAIWLYLIIAIDNYVILCQILSNNLKESCYNVRY